MFENKKLNEFKENIKGKNIAVIGMGVSNIPLTSYLLEIGTNITVLDRKTEEQLDKDSYEEYKGKGVKFILGENYLDGLEGFDYIFRSPSMRPDEPHLLKELDRGAILTSEIEMLIELCPGKVIGVTGSDGKTTTTTLIHKILEEDGYHCYLGGNIGIPLFAKIDEMKPDDIIVLELSSFQLMTFKKSPNISIVTNISPNHLDIHKDYEEYIDAKRNIFKYQDKNGIVVLNYDNDITKGMIDEAPGEVRLFSIKEKLDNGVCLVDDEICVMNDGVKTPIINRDDILLLGDHNVANSCTAIAAIHDMVKPESIVNVLTTFKGVEHRNELVRELDGVKWYNDSIGSSPTRTIAGLLSFKQKVILIAGGYDKHLDYTELGKYIKDHVSTLILLGQTKEKIKTATLEVTKDIPIYECETLEDTINKAREIAKSGDIVFFSPASASFDMFKNFMERGDKYKELVNKL